MKQTKIKVTALVIGLILIISLMVVVVSRNAAGAASAESIPKEESIQENDSSVEYNLIENPVYATFSYTCLSNNECSVRISNKSVANVASIQPLVIINNIEYKVVEIEANGFMSCPNLIRVSVPVTLKKIGNMAFANCPKLDRINLSNVEEIGDNVFYRCSGLQEIIIPASVKSMGSYVFRNNNTKIKLRSTEVCENWSKTWNLTNKNQDIDFDCRDIQPWEAETYSSPLTRSDTKDETCILSGGQPRTDLFYLSNENFNNVAQPEGNNWFIPEKFDSMLVAGISFGAFDGIFFDQLIIEYSSTPIQISDGAFSFANDDFVDETPTDSAIIINRDIEFQNTNNGEISSIFAGAKVKSIVLPDSLDSITDSMFYDCKFLENIYFRQPQENLSRPEELKILQSAENENKEKINAEEKLAQKDNISAVFLPKNLMTIGESAFGNTTKISNLIIYDKVQKVGKSVLANWNDETQTVYVHNTKNIEYADDKWHNSWCGDFQNIYFDINSIKVKFDPNDGELDKEFVERASGDKYGELPKPTREGYRFDGWQLNGEIINEDETIVAKQDITLIAKWTKIYKVNLRDRDSGEIYCTVYAAWGEYLPLKDINDNDINIQNSKGTIITGFYSEDNRSCYYIVNESNNLWGARDPWDKKEDGDIFAKKQIITYIINYICTDLDPAKNDNERTFVYQDIENDKFCFETILDKDSNPVRKVVWDLKSIKDAANKDLKNNVLTVTGKWYTAQAHLTFELNGGTIKTNNTTLNFGDVFIDKPIKLLSDFDGWLVNNKFVYEFTYNDEYVGNSEIDEICLVAQWLPRTNGKLFSIPSNSTYYEITANGVYRLPASFNYYCHIYINTDVNNVYIYSDTSQINKYYMYIETGMRFTDLDLKLENFELIPPNDQVGIKVAKNGTKGLNLYTYGTVIIHGGNGSAGDSNNWDGRDGRVAIDCDRITIFCGDDLYILGGNGGKNYLTGKHGDGGYAVDANEVRICRAEGNKIRIYGGDGINYTKSPFPSKTTVTYFD